MNTNSFFLAFETSTDVLSAGIFKNEQLIALQEYHLGKSHNRLITASCDQIFNNLNITPSEIKAIAVSSGPGSYTGLRVGTAAAKGFCFGANIPLIEVPGLKGLALQVLNLAKQLNAKIIPMIDARRMEVYTAVYDSNLNEMVPPHPRILTEQPISELTENQVSILIGDGCRKLMSEENMKNNLIFLPEVVSSVKGWGNFINLQYRQQNFVDLFTFEPFYLKEVAIREQKNKTVN